MAPVATVIVSRDLQATAALASARTGLGLPYHRRGRGVIRLQTHASPPPATTGACRWPNQEEASDSDGQQRALGRDRRVGYVEAECLTSVR